jgi:hypothetical protein
MDDRIFSYSAKEPGGSGGRSRGGASKAADGRQAGDKLSPDQGMANGPHPLNGNFVVNAESFALFEKCIQTPEEPSELTKQAETLARKLYG